MGDGVLPGGRAGEGTSKKQKQRPKWEMQPEMEEDEAAARQIWQEQSPWP